MRKLLILPALLLTACAGTPAPPDCSHTIDLPHAAVEVGLHDSYTALKPDAGWVLVRWTADGNISGSDNVYGHTPDHIALGCLDHLQVTEADWR